MHEVPVVDDPVGGGVLAHGRHPDAVADRGRAQRDGVEECRGHASRNRHGPGAIPTRTRRAGPSRQVGPNPVTATTASPASSEAARSTSAVIAPVVVALRVVEDLAHPPAAGLARRLQQRRAAGVGAGADLVVLVEVRRRSPPATRSASQPGVGVQLAQLVPAPQRGQLDPPEHRVAHQHPERPRVGGDRRRLGVDGAAGAVARPSVPGRSAAPTRRAGWSRSGGRARRATR